MWLKFIGANGSMGLTNGEVYDVKVKTKKDYIWVTMSGFELRDKVWGVWECPYSSPQSFAANWAKP